MRVRMIYLLAVIASGILLVAACSAGTQSATSGATAAAKTSAPAALASAQAGAGSGASSVAALVATSSKQAPSTVINLQAGRVGSGKPLYTRGFNVWNLTSSPLKLASVIGASPEGRPPAGNVIQPGAYDHYEITWWFTIDQFVTVLYDSCSSFQCSATMKVIGLDGGVYTTCQSVLEKQGLCSAGGSANGTITFLDPPGTVRNIPSSQGQAQKNTLYQLCAENPAATCNFTATGEQQTYGSKNVVGAVNPNHTQNEIEVDDTCSYTAGIADTWGGEITVGVEKIVTAEITASYHHEVSNETTFEHRVTYTVQPGYVGWTTISWPVYRDVGNFTITMGHTTWHLDGVYFDIPYTDSQHVPTWDSHTAPEGDPSIPPHSKSATPANGCTPAA